MSATARPRRCSSAAAPGAGGRQRGYGSLPYSYSILTLLYRSHLTVTDTYKSSSYAPYGAEIAYTYAQPAKKADSVATAIEAPETALLKTLLPSNKVRMLLAGKPISVRELPM